MCIAIQNILTLAKQTFERKIGLDGTKKPILESEGILESLNEIAEALKKIDVQELGLDKSPSLFPGRLHEHPSNVSNEYSVLMDNEKSTSQQCNEQNLDTSEKKAVLHKKQPITYIR